MFFVSGAASFVVFYRSSLLRVAVWKNFRERTFVFAVVVGLVFFDIFLGFCVYGLASFVPKMFLPFFS